MSGGATSSRRRRRRERVDAIARVIRTPPLSDVIRDNALVHLPPAAAARLRAVHPSWAAAMSSRLFAVAHAAAPRRASGVFVPSAGFLPFAAAGDDDDNVPSPSLAFVPASSGVTVLSSSRGVACCFSAVDDAYAVCNPATTSWSAVPSPPRRTRPRPAIVVLFDTNAYNFRGDYTLVCPFESTPGSGAYCFQVFTSGAGVWWVTDAVATAEGLVAASGVAAGRTAWWRTSIGTAVGYSPVTDRVEIVLCPGDSEHWEIGSVAGTLHCAVRDGRDVAVFRLLDHHGVWEEAARVAVAEILQLSDAEEEEEDDGVRLLGFQGAEVEVVVLSGRRLVAFDARTRQRREVAVPGEVDARWDGEEYATHTNTLASIAPAILVEEPPLAEQPAVDDQEMVLSS
uniref:F-box domain-containing protein n=1 Tax=Leersia perrieri TaxID=77586 RepID=A0A0D9VZN6_9ORYZ